MNYFFQGLTMGLAYVAPIGLQNLFVINTALTHKRGHALLTALIVIFFDVTLALACFFGVGLLMERYQWLQMLILLAGSIIVLVIGIQLLRAKPDTMDSNTPKSSDASFFKIVSTACVVTWFNPQALIDGTMMLGAFRVTLLPTQSLPFILGVTLASCLWFTGITLLVSTFNHWFNSRVLLWINRICGSIILLYGGKLFYSFILLLH